MVLMIMIMEINKEIKWRSCTNGSYQRACTDKHECTSPTSDFHSVKHVCGVASKERREAATTRFPCFSYGPKLTMIMSS